MLIKKYCLFSLGRNKFSVTSKIILNNFNKRNDNLHEKFHNSSKVRICFKENTIIKIYQTSSERISCLIHKKGYNFT